VPLLVTSASGANGTLICCSLKLYGSRDDRATAQIIGYIENGMCGPDSYLEEFR
jgi:hypothetical protein